MIRTSQQNKKTVRCATYTRKSTDEGLDKEFNSLDAQRESAEAYIKSQAHEGWASVAGQYDDGGFTGGNMDRPALQRLMADIEAGKIDCVVVYKVDRLSRSLLDFARMMEVFERHHVSFVSVTQQFNTSTPMGRLILHVLLSFAQFERELISERTRDKMSAARRKGRWLGGRPVLGYDVDRPNSVLVINEDEANRVRAIFDLYLDHRSLLAVVQELERRGWRNKSWKTKAGRIVGDRPIVKNSLFQLLTNVTYLGKVRFKGEIHPGRHAAIIDEDKFRRVQETLRSNSTTGGALVKNKSGALLKGMLRCGACHCAMSHSFSTRGKVRYRYYVCQNAQKRGWNVCPDPSIPAAEIERFVVEQIRGLGLDQRVVNATVSATLAKADAERQSLDNECTALGHELARYETEMHSLVGKTDLPSITRLAELHDMIRRQYRRLAELRGQITKLVERDIVKPEVADALAQFDSIWNAMPPRHQVRLIQLLVETVEYNGATSDVTIQFRPAGIDLFTHETKEDNQ